MRRAGISGCTSPAVGSEPTTRPGEMLSSKTSLTVDWNPARAEQILGLGNCLVGHRGNRSGRARPHAEEPAGDCGEQRRDHQHDNPQQPAASGVPLCRVLVGWRGALARLLLVPVQLALGALAGGAATSRRRTLGAGWGSSGATTARRRDAAGHWTSRWSGCRSARAIISVGRWQAAYVSVGCWNLAKVSVGISEGAGT